MTATNLTAVARETGRTGGWLQLKAPAAFLRRLKGQNAPRKVQCAPAKQNIFATQVWLVTWQHQNGDVQTNTVMISGVWQMAEIEAQARNALHRQHNIPNANITRLTMDCSK